MTKPLQMPVQSSLQVLAVPAFHDNYLWLIHDGRHAAVVDPGDAAPILAALERHGLALTAILLTHHHADHIGGVPRLLEHASQLPGDAAPIPVFGPAGDGIAAVTRPLADGDVVNVPGLDLTLAVLDVPGHTRGHIAYVRDGAAPMLFCGDTLFAGGCGRLFEGTPEQMAASLDKLAALAPATQVFCAHEYTLSNLRFAAAVDPGNAALAARIVAESAKREQGLPTVPSTIALERATNPFVRYREHSIAETLAQAGKVAPGAPPLAVFAALRQWKNTY